MTADLAAIADAADSARGPDAAPAGDPGPDAVAIVGIACRFGDTEGPQEFWRALVEGRELLTHGPAAARPGWVSTAGVLRDGLAFDPAPFGIPPMEALLMDPQHRIFLEACWHALEDAGHAPATFDGDIAVFGGIGANTYEPLLRAADLGWSVDRRMLGYGNDKDFAIGRVAFRLGLTGPSVGVQTACSTSLTAVHLACQSLVDYDCDLALAGGASLDVNRGAGYAHEAGGILAPDGHCRPFDSSGAGIVPSDGVAVVALRRYADAVRDGDAIVAAIIGSAVRNDGAAKVGFSAPTVAGQVAAARAALAVAGVDPSTVTLIETHGTATALGDPIEAAALREVYGEGDDSCVLSAAKGILGHTDTASGAAGLIAAALALRHRHQPAVNHFRALNPAVDLTGSRVRVLDHGRPWRATGPRRAAVNSLGIGGTDVHVVLQEVPAAPPRPGGDGRLHAVPLTAATPAALRSLATAMGRYAATDPPPGIGDLAFTMQAGRTPLRHRAVVLAGDMPALARRLDEGAYLTGEAATGAVAAPTLALVFPGGGAQRAGMASGLYRHLPPFRDALADLTAEVDEHLAEPLRAWVGDGLRAGRAAVWIERPDLALPALFLVELALARTVEELGGEAGALLGHSLGEYTAATLAGVFSAADAYRVVRERGRILTAVDGGLMLSVAQPEPAIRDRIAAAGLDVAALNGATNTVVTGPADRITTLAAALHAEGVDTRTLPLATAAHGRAIDPFLPGFTEFLAETRLRTPRRRFVSNVTGTWADPEAVTRPEYWATHLRQPVRFAEGLATLAADGPITVLEVGPGGTLCSLARRELGEAVRTLPTLGRGDDPAAEPEAFLTALATLWIGGWPVKWTALHGNERPRRVPAPVYPFQRRRFVPAPAGRPVEVRLPMWRPAWTSETPAPAGAGRWIVVADGADPAPVTARLTAAGHIVQVCAAAELSARLGALADDAAVDVLDLSAPDPAAEPDENLAARFRQALRHCATVGAAIAAAGAPVRLTVLTRGACRVLPDDRPDPALAPYRSIVATVPVETGTPATLLDLDGAGVAAEDAARWMTGAGRPAVAAFRLGRWWRPAEQPADITTPAVAPAGDEPFVAVVTGGLGGVGAQLAGQLAATRHARLLLVSRRGETDPGASAVRDRLRDLGGGVAVLGLDITAPGAAETALRAAVDRFGRVDLVLHAAALPVGAMLEVRAEAAGEALHAVKVDATLALAAAMRDVPGVAAAATLVLTSSRAVAGGSAGAYDYLAANLFLDAFAALPGGPRRLAVAWDRWQGVGMAKALQQRHSRLTGEDLVDGMAPAAAAAAFAGCLALADRGEPAVTVAAAMSSPFVPSPALASPAPVEDGDDIDAAPGPTTAPPRSGESPQNELERTVAAVWSEALHLARVGRDDNFFDLGGDSLVGLQVTRRLRTLLGRHITIRTLFASPTPRELAAALADAPDAETVPELVPAVRLSLADIRRRLQERSDADA